MANPRDATPPGYERVAVTCSWFGLDDLLVALAGDFPRWARPGDRDAFLASVRSYADLAWDTAARARREGAPDAP